MNLDLSQAQVIGDTTVFTQVNSIGSDAFEITGGQEIGGNLFHSFAQFSVPEGGRAYFKNRQPITNIFSRVTGESPSIIDGIIQANGNANFFLLNPRGIRFSRELTHIQIIAI